MDQKIQSSMTELQRHYSKGVWEAVALSKIGYPSTCSTIRLLNFPPART